MEGIVISLCDYTGIMVEPWVKDGYEAILVDPQHDTRTDKFTNITYIGRTIEKSLFTIASIIKNKEVKMVFGFPPCTDVSVSGARWWKAKRLKDPYFQAKAAIIAEQCRMIGALSGAPWFFENPVSAFSGIFGKPDYTFHPYEYNRYCKDDNYTKKTCLWTGNGFKMPDTSRDLKLGPPDDRIHKMAPSPDRQNIRSATPKGFAQAVYEANK